MSASTLEGLVASWRRPLAGARQRANTNEDFREIRLEEEVRNRCADELAALLRKEKKP